MNYVLIVVFDKEGRRVLLTNKLRGPKGTIGKLTCQGGKVEKDEGFKEAAIRELKEETGIVRKHLTPVILTEYADDTVLAVYCTQLVGDECFRQIEDEVLNWYHIEYLTNVKDDRLAGYGNLPFFIHYAKQILEEANGTN